MPISRIFAIKTANLQHFEQGLKRMRQRLHTQFLAITEIMQKFRNLQENTITENGVFSHSLDRRIISVFVYG